MDLERMILKAAITIAGIIAVSLGSNGISDFAKQRSNDAARATLEQNKLEKQAQKEKRHLDDHIESLHHQEAERQK